jgi:hypothetical protein
METALDADPAGFNNYEQNLVAQIRQHGWFGTHVSADPGFSYTTGIWHKFAFPEVIVFSLPRDIAHDTCWHIYRGLEAGRRFPVGQATDDVFGNYAAVLAPVAPRHCAEYLRSSRWFYRTSDFPCLQLVFPDERGHFPWSPEATEEFRRSQPDLTADNWSGLQVSG